MPNIGMAILKTHVIKVWTAFSFKRIGFDGREHLYPLKDGSASAS